MEFGHVKFRYVPDVPLIEDMNLRVQPGQRIALVGPTGCGKTTLVNLLMRFYEINGGTLKVDGHPNAGFAARQPGYGLAGNLAESRYCGR